MNVGDVLTAETVANANALAKTGDWINWAILILMSFLTLKDLIAPHVRPKRKFFKRFFYKSEEIVTNRVLEILGYPPEKYGEFRRKVSLIREGDRVETLVQILANSTIQSENKEEITWASHKTQYYINTMGAAHNKEICSHMVSLLEKLRVEVEGSENVDFVFSLKEANTPLCSAYANNRGIISILAKGKDDKSYVTAGMKEIDAEINFEGFSELEKAYIRTQKKLRGIAIACNLSNGSTMLKRIESFNEAIYALQMTEKVEPITKVFILYRANSEDCVNGRPTLDEKFQQSGLTCYRYFDLSEDLKEELFKIHSKMLEVNQFKCVTCINTNKKNAKQCKYSGRCFRSIKGVKKNKSEKN